MKTLLLALGNPILSDDGVAWIIADRLLERLPTAEYTVMKESGATFDLVPKFAGYDRLVVIDAILLGQKPVGSLYQLTLSHFESTIRATSAHDINFASAFALGRKLGYKIPTDIRIFGIEVKELRRFSESLSPQVQERLDVLVKEIYNAIAD
ncbi:MAG: hydrogenase maturation protease [Chitinivibrionales bacterium]|nr:hydrogenase maturation protease [Chitinivibrionales bacterium]